MGSHGHSWFCWQYACLIKSPHGHTPYHLAESFAATGWRIGWLIAPKSIIQPTLAASTRIVFCTNSPLQEAAASGLEQAKERNFFETQNEEYAERRAILCDAFDKLGLKYTLPEGSYFVLLVRTDIALASSFLPFNIHNRTFLGWISPSIIRSLKA